MSNIASNKMSQPNSDSRVLSLEIKWSPNGVIYLSTLSILNFLFLSNLTNLLLIRVFVRCFNVINKYPNKFCFNKYQFIHSQNNITNNSQFFVQLFPTKLIRLCVPCCFYFIFQMTVLKNRVLSLSKQSLN